MVFPLMAINGHLSINGPSVSFSDPHKQVFIALRFSLALCIFPVLRLSTQQTLPRLCCLPQTFPTHSWKTLLSNCCVWLCIGKNICGYIMMLSFPRHIYSSRRTSVPYPKGKANNGGFRSKTGGLASEKGRLETIWLRRLSSDNTHIMS